MHRHRVQTLIYLGVEQPTEPPEATWQFLIRRELTGNESR